MMVPHFLSKQSALMPLLALACALGAQAQSPPQPAPPTDGGWRPFGKPTTPTSTPAPEPETTLKVDVKLVNVFATVVDAHGAPVAGLAKENFSVSEDGREQKIAVFERESALPLSVVLSLDTSGSTRKDLPLEVQSARHFAHAVLRPQDVLSLYSFNEIVDEVVPFTPSVKEVDRGLDRLRAGSATALFDAVMLGANALQDRRGRKVMVVITDGGDTASRVDYQQALRSAQEAEAIVYSIIVVPVEANAGRELGGEHALIQLSEDTGGKHYYASSAAGLDAAFAQISDQLRTQYLIGYYPSQKLTDSEFRRIQLKVQGENLATGLQVRNRAGYYTAPSR